MIQVLEDLDGARRVTSQREVSVVAAAFGCEEGDLVLTLVFATPGRKRVVFSLLTDEREQSDPARIESTWPPERGRRPARLKIGKGEGIIATVLRTARGREDQLR